MAWEEDGIVGDVGELLRHAAIQGLGVARGLAERPRRLALGRLIATGAGLQVRDPEGDLVGSIEVPGGSSNFVLTDVGIFVMGETSLYVLD